jgi:hypothetical protein
MSRLCRSRLSQLAGLGLVVAASVVLSGCSSHQAYASGQAYQRNECQKLPDAGSRSRCLQAAGLSAQAYRREAESLRSAP